MGASPGCGCGRDREASGREIRRGGPAAGRARAPGCGPRVRARARGAGPGCGREPGVRAGGRSGDPAAIGGDGLAGDRGPDLDETAAETMAKGLVIG